jgi:outer membrane protein OmpA-like peptidoglycan-associated protein/tetratricopeptide (TPR) repeat protein
VVDSAGVILVAPALPDTITRINMLNRSSRLLILAAFLLAVCACTYTLKIKDGHTAYDRKQFHNAIPMLESEIGHAKSKAEKGQLAFLLGDAYRRTGQEEKALPWFKMAYDNQYGTDAMKAWAFSLKKTERYAEARDVFKNLGIEIGSPYEFRKEVTACTIAEDWQKQSPASGWTVEPAAFNSPQNDYAPAFYADGRLVFTSDRALGKGDETYQWTGQKFMDLFIVEPDAASAQPFDIRLNTPGNEGTACFNKSGSEIFFTKALAAYKGDDAFCKIYVSEKKADGGWDEPGPLPYQKEKINYLHPALSSDGNILYFSCNDPEGWGGYDLYAMARNKKNELGWDEPKMLSRNINTGGNELFPTIDADTLYFASDGLQGMGGLDIFKTYKVEKNTWSPPHNLKAPVNSGSDDFGFIIDGRQPHARPSKPGDLIRSGYFTSNRSGGRGEDDIYRFEQRIPPPKPPKKDTTIASSSSTTVHKMVLEIYVVEKVLANPEDPNSKILGRKPLNGAVIATETGNKKQSFTVKEDGFHKIELAENTDYTFNASLNGYLSNGARFSTKGIAKDPANPVQVFELEIILDKIYRNREIVLENIYYDYDKWDIRPDAEPTLNRLANVLKQNPSIRIQLGSHTDCRGNDNYNQELSQRRAQSAVDYLIGKGINAERLSAFGYGESQPAVTCACARCTEPEHQMNRRTTFKVLE